MSTTTMTTTPTIPLELVDIILDYAHNDLPLLTACSLVCRAWFPSARYHIFYSASLDAQNAPFFARLLDAPLSTIPHFIRRIEAKDTYEGERWLSSLFPRLSVLPALTSVSIASSFDTTFSEDTLSTLASFDTLVELKLTECAFEDFAQVQKLLCSLPVLERLHLEADWPEPRQITPTDESPSPRLTEVYLRCEASHVLEWLMMAPQVAPVSKLTLHGVDADDLPTLTRYLQALGPALTHLTIFPSGSLYDVLCSHLDLSIHPSLTYLKLAIDCDASNLLMARDLLTQVHSPAFKEVELSFYSIRQVAKTAEQWTGLDELLVKPRFDGLERVTVSAMIAARKARETLPRCQERGILNIVYQ